MTWIVSRSEGSLLAHRIIITSQSSFVERSPGQKLNFRAENGVGVGGWRGKEEG